MQMGDNIQWQRIEKDMWRAKVRGGWILQKRGFETDALVFIPDEGHKWACSELITECVHCGSAGTVGSGDSKKKCPQCKGKGGHYL